MLVTITDPKDSMAIVITAESMATRKSNAANANEKTKTEQPTEITTGTTTGTTTETEAPTAMTTDATATTDKMTNETTTTIKTNNQGLMENWYSRSVVTRAFQQRHVASEPKVLPHTEMSRTENKERRKTMNSDENSKGLDNNLRQQKRFRKTANPNAA